VGLVDSFYDRQKSGELGFYRLTPDELDALDWQHFITLVEPGRWQDQYCEWLPVRLPLLRMHTRRTPTREAVTAVHALRQGVHQYLDDADYAYQRLHLHLGGGLEVAVDADDPGGDAVGVESLGQGEEEVGVVRRLGGLVHGRPAAPELVVRLPSLRAGQLA
jgi:hypothetical protein